MNSFTIGSDAEVALKTANGSYKSAVGLIGGSKESPRKTKNGYVQEDNVLAEFNVNPAETEEEFIQNTLLILKDLEDLITPLDLTIDISATALYDESELEHELAKLVGCDPDYDAWTLKTNESPCLDTTTMRSCGGHLHVAFDRAKHDMMSRPHMVRVLDLVAGVPSILMDSDSNRRELYGKAGAHRPKMIQANDPYDGVEYRTLSNFWLRSTDTIGWAYRAVSRAVNNFDNLLSIANKNSDRIINTINNSDIAEAKRLVNEYDLEVVNGVY